GGADRQALGGRDHLGALRASALLRRAVAGRPGPLGPPPVAAPARARERGPGGSLGVRRHAATRLLRADREGPGPSAGDPRASRLGPALERRLSPTAYHSRGLPAGMRSRTSTPSTISTGCGSVVARKSSSWP